MNCVSKNGNGGAIYFATLSGFEMKGGIFKGCLVEKCVLCTFFIINFFFLISGTGEDMYISKTLTIDSIRNNVTCVYSDCEGVSCFLAKQINLGGVYIFSNKVC
jgi:hypothetical protein